MAKIWTTTKVHDLAKVWLKLEYSSAGFTAQGEPKLRDVTGRWLGKAGVQLSRIYRTRRTKLRDVTGRWLGKLEYSSAGFTALGEPKLRDVTGRWLGNGDGVGGGGLIYS